jgi:hypothetical protein
MKRAMMAGTRRIFFITAQKLRKGWIFVNSQFNKRLDFLAERSKRRGEWFKDLCQNAKIFKVAQKRRYESPPKMKRICIAGSGRLINPTCRPKRLRVQKEV